MTLDLIRGVAVLGILTINIAGFAQPMITSIAPNLLHQLPPADEAVFGLNLLLFEGKMRALFTLLFGAGIMLFWERAEASGRNGDKLQLRRLCWLMLLGVLHYLLLWWGDILFVYAVCGVVALLLRPLGERTLLAIALIFYYAWHVWGMLDMSPLIDAESALRLHAASPEQVRAMVQWSEPVRAWAAQELAESRLGYLHLLHTKLTERPFWQIQMVSGSFSETLPLMLVGMVLYRRGFFDGRLPNRRLVAVTAACTSAGLILTAGFAIWAWFHHFPPVAMHAAMSWGLAMPHLFCGIGYAGLLVLMAPRLIRTALGERIVAAGRMAFSNYVLTSLIMTCTFYGWGLKLFGTVGPLAQWAFVMLGWAVMLGWSMPWLHRFRRGPLEWLWRSLVENRILENRIH